VAKKSTSANETWLCGFAAETAFAIVWALATKNGTPFDSSQNGS